MHKMISVVGLVLLVSAPVVASEDDEALEGDPIDPGLTVVIDVPEYRAARDPKRFSEGIPHKMRVSGVVTGQRIPLPRDADGGCRLDAKVGEEGDMPPLRIEFDPDGRHWWQHAITTVSGSSIDAINCEVVVTVAIGRDRVRRKLLRRPTPELLERIFGNRGTPASGDESSVTSEAR
jgi:hypothetical protein